MVPKLQLVRHRPAMMTRYKPRAKPRECVVAWHRLRGSCTLVVLTTRSGMQAVAIATRLGDRGLERLALQALRAACDAAGRGDCSDATAALVSATAA